jgi:hypothetical protein
LGVDVANWHYRDGLGLSRAHFLCEDVTRIGGFGENTFNILVFPKSIGEFPDTVFSQICQMVRDCTFIEDRIVLACSLMLEGERYDVDRLQSLQDAILSHGFRLKNQVSKGNLGSYGLNCFCPGFDYPDDVKSKVRLAINFCPKYIENAGPCESACTDRLIRSPMLLASYVNYKLLCFER